MKIESDAAHTAAVSAINKNREAKSQVRDGYAAVESDKDRADRESKALVDTIKVNVCYVMLHPSINQQQ
jgi:hypothetical protein